MFNPGSFAIAALVLLLPLSAAAGDVTVVYSEALKLIDNAGSSGDAVVSDERPRVLSFNALDRRFDVALKPNHALFDAATRARLADEVVAYRGTLQGVPGSWARVSMVDGMPQGVIWDGREMFAVEPSAITPGTSIVYRLSDMIIEPGTLGCGQRGSTSTGKQLLAALSAEVTPEIGRAAGATSQIDIGIVTDSEFFTRSLGNPEAAMVARMNVVDGIYSEQIGVQLNLSFVDDYGATSDPFSDATVAGDLLDELEAYRTSTPAQLATGLTHLFTGRDLDGSTAGIAYIGSLCRDRFGIGLTQATRTVTTDALIAAHEFGHNFGAKHDGEDGSGCESVPDDQFLMAPSVSGNDQFSACSLEAIQVQVDRANCISTLSTVDVGISEAGTPATVLAGESGSVSFDVDNVGSETANNVAVSIALDNDVRLDSVSAPNGTCTSGAGVAQCDLGSIAVGSGRTVTLNATRDTAGRSVFIASVSADGDVGDANNEASSALQFDAVADLEVGAADASVVVDQSVEVIARIANLGNAPATQVVLTVTPGQGLQLDSVEWIQAACVIDNNSVTCDPTTLGQGISNEVRIGLTGVSLGDRSYTLAVSSETADDNSINNVATGNINVTSAVAAPAPAAGGDGDGGGGGSTGWSWLLLLATLCLARSTRGSRVAHLTEA